jgi:hypothetical protein
MNVRRRYAATRYSPARAMGLFSLGLALSACVAAPATPGHPSPTPPIFCDDGPNARTPMPADCVVPGQLSAPSPSMPVPETTAAEPAATLPASLATLPPAVPWHGKTFYTPPSDTGSRLIGLGPDDTVYVLLERPLPLPDPTPTTLFMVPDVETSVIALRPDGSMRPGWPSSGVPVSGFPMDYQVNDEGIVYVASGPNPYSSSDGILGQLTITAIGSDGKVLAGWPYTAPAAQVALDQDLLVLGPDGMVCLMTVKPGVVASGYDVPKVVYCLGRDGKMMFGWPYAANRLWNLAIGPDGTVYMGQTTSIDVGGGVFTFPFHILAIGIDGKPKPAWTPWEAAANQGLTAILPLKDGRVYVLLGGDGGTARLVVVDATGKELDDHAELKTLLKSPNYKDAVLTKDGSLFVATTDQDSSGLVDVVNAYSPAGSQLAGWPQLIGGWGDVAVGRDGSVWVAWTVYGSGSASDETSVVALFDKSGRLQPGYPMASDYLLSYHSSYGLAVASDGTAYCSAATATGSRIVALAR